MLHFDESRKAKRRRSDSAPQLISTRAPITSGMVRRVQSSQILPQDVPSLQRTIGNHRIQRMLSTSGKPPTIQRENDEEQGQVDDTSVDDMPELEEVSDDDPNSTVKTVDGGEGEHLLEEMPELEQGESPGFSLLGEETAKAGAGKNTASKQPGDPRSRYVGGSNQQNLAETTKKSKTPGQHLQEFGAMLKRFGINNTVGFYGKGGVYSFLVRDEKHIAKAEKYYAKGIKHPDEEEGKQLLVSAIQQLRGISGATKIDSKAWAKRVQVALLAPVWTIKQRILHARWKAIMRKLGVKDHRQVMKERMKKDSTVTPKEEGPKHEWWRANPEAKDWFEKFNVDQTVRQVGYHGKGMTDRERWLVWKKWRMRELSDQSVIAGGHKLSWMPHYTDKDQEREETPGVKLGKQRWHMQSPRGRVRQSDFRIGIHRPDWRFERPRGKRGSGIEMGKHRPIWGFNKPTGERSSSMEMGKHRPEWEMETPTQERSSSIKMGRHREWLGFHKPGTRQGAFKQDVKLGRQRPDWGYTPDGERTSSIEVGSHRPIWGFDKPSGEQSGITMGSHRPIWGFNKPNGDRSRVKLGKHRKWGFDKPEGPRGPISTSQHRIPWEEARQRHIRLPGMSPQISGHRNLLSPNEVPPMPEGWQQSQSGLTNTSNPLPLNWLPNHVPGLTGPSTTSSTTSSTEESTGPVPIEENGDYTVVNPIKKVKQGRKNTTLEPKRWFFLVRIYTEGKKAMAEIELDDLSTATVPVASLEGNVALR